MSIELMKQALEAIELSHPRFGVATEIYKGAIANLRAAIEHAERPQTHSEECWRWHHQCAVTKIERMQAQELATIAPTCNKDPLVCWRVVCRLNGKCENTIQQRQWQGLTDKDALALWKDRSDGPTNREIISFCRAIEAKLKEKNT